MRRADQEEIAAGDARVVADGADAGTRASVYVVAVDHELVCDGGAPVLVDVGADVRRVRN